MSWLPPHKFNFGAVILALGAKVLKCCSLTNTYTHSHTHSRTHKYSHIHTITYTRYLGIPGDLQTRISEYFEYLTIYNHPGPEAINLLSQLPHSMFHDISTWMFFEVVNKVRDITTWLFLCSGVQ